VPSKRFAAFLLTSLLVLLAADDAAFAQSSQQLENVIIQTPKPYSKLVADIRALGGLVTQQYKYVDAIAAGIPSNAMDALRSAAGSATIIKDLTIPAPGPAAVRNVKGGAASPISNVGQMNATAPAAYRLNNLGLNVAGLHSVGYTGAGVYVAVVDSGVRPKYPVLDSDSSVIGGIDFVGDGLGFSNSKNSPHGTFVAGLISGNTLINVHHSTLEASLQEHFPGVLSGSDLPLIGTAPACEHLRRACFRCRCLRWGARIAHHCGHRSRDRFEKEVSARRPDRYQHTRLQSQLGEYDVVCRARCFRSQCRCAPCKRNHSCCFSRRCRPVGLDGIQPCDVTVVHRGGRHQPCRQRPCAGGH
jgi:hypothetical protein